MTTVTDHLLDRRFDMNLHKVWVNEEDRCATFPLWNLSGQMVGYQRYQPDSDDKKCNDPTLGRYFTRVGSKEIGTYGKEKWSDGKFGVWGLESWNLTNTLFVTEGVFDASKLTWFGCSAIAVTSYAVNVTGKKWLWAVRKVRPVVVVCDNDPSGMKLAKYGHRYVVTEDGDLGDASDDYVMELVKEYQT